MDNLGTVNTILQSQGMEVELKSVDEWITFATQLPGSEWLQYLSKYMQTYYTFLGMINEYGIETTYDILLPDYLYQNLYTDDNQSLPDGYWTLSSNAGYSRLAWRVYCDGHVYDYYVFNDSDVGVRPVITVSKSKLLK